MIMITSILNTYGENYYVSSSIVKSKKSGTIKNPLSSLDELSKIKLTPGDTVFFKCGDEFYGTLNIGQSGTTQQPIVYTSYGNGSKPVITGSYHPEKWLKNNNNQNLYSLKVGENEIFGLIKENKFIHAARYPEKEWLYFDGGGRDYMIDSSLHLLTEELVGSTIRMRIKNWSYQYRKIKDVKADTVFFDDVLWYNNYVNYTADAGWGYYLENHLSFLDKDGEWAYIEKDNLLYYYATNNDLKNIEIIGKKRGIQVAEKVDAINILNIHVRNFYDSGIEINAETNNIKIENCEVENIVLHGIKSLEGAVNMKVSGCKVQNVLGQGISLLECNNSLITNNTVTRIGLLPGYGINGNNGGMGIIITNNEIRPEGYNRIAHHNIISNNLVDSIGSYPIRMDGTYSICEKNIVSNGLLTLNDGALIYCWAMDSTFTHHNIIRDNIAMFTHGNLEGTPYNHFINAGIYIDNDVHHVQVENNYISGTQIGILFNCGSHSNSAKNNTIFNNDIGVAFSENSYEGSIYNDTIINNIIIGEDYGQKSMVLKSYVGAMVQPGIIDNNYHYNSKEKFLFQIISTHENFRRTDEMNITRWKSLGMGEKSTSLQIIEGFTIPELIVNKSLQEKKINLVNSARTVDGKVINSINIPPISGTIIFHKP